VFLYFFELLWYHHGWSTFQFVNSVYAAWSLNYYSFITTTEPFSFGMRDRTTSSLLRVINISLHVMHVWLILSDHLFSMMLGLAVTRWVLVPTSSTYSFDSGGRLHLNEHNKTYMVYWTFLTHTCTIYWKCTYSGLKFTLTYLRNRSFSSWVTP